MKKLIVLGLAVTLLLLGCGKPADETTAPTTEPTIVTEVPTTAAPTTEPTTVPTTVPTEPAPVDTNPLTGEALDEVCNQRPVAVQINNHKAALPQCGIGQADLIYEILAEGNITRFTAYFTDVKDAGPVGPIRSLRAYYLDIMRGYDAICVSAGGSAEADGMVRNLDYDRLNAISGFGSRYCYRWKRGNEAYEHRLFVKGEDILNGAEYYDMRTTDPDDKDYGMTFTKDPFTAGDANAEIGIEFLTGGKTTTLTYQADKGYYTAYQQGQTLVDGNTMEEIPFRNVLVLRAETSTLDSEGHRRVVTTGEGEGYYARDGHVIPMTWKRDSDTSTFEYYDEAGNPIPFGVGKSYIAVIPTGSPVTLS